MKKFLFFTFLTILLLVGAAGFLGRYLLMNDYVVFIESFGGGVLTVDSLNTEGEDNKYRVICKYNQPLTVNINPERNAKRYYDLARLIVNGEDVTDQVSMLQYKTHVTRKMSITATFERVTAPGETATAATASSVRAPKIDATNDTPYLGSLGAYNLSDPAVIYDEDSRYYYAFASDNYVVHSKDLINWTGKTNYFDTVITDDAAIVLDFSQFKSVNAWAKQHGYEADLKYSSPTNNREVLAPDVIQWGETTYLYFSLSKEENHNESAIFCVSTTDLENAISHKKWKDCGLVISTCSDDKDTKANAVHPGVFEGADGKLYMVYGGYYGKSKLSGAIYLVELDPKTGLLKENSPVNQNGGKISTAHGKTAFNAGTLITDPGTVSGKDKNHGSVISGADMIYQEDTNSYYLFMTYGVPETNQSIRVARAKTVTGPFTDPTDHDMSRFESTALRNQYSKGLPLLCGYNFDKSNSGGVSYANVGKASPGSPSVFQSKDGDWFLASHSQIYFKAEGVLTTGTTAAKNADLDVDAAPSLEIRRVLWELDGWPVALPEAYAGETLDREVLAKHMYGNWDVIVFPRNESVDIGKMVCTHSQTVSIIDTIAISEKNISRAAKPSHLHFSANANGTFEVLLDGDTYTVTPALCWDWELKAGVLTFSGTAENGNVVWGKKAFSSKMGLYTDTFDYLLSQADEQTAAVYRRALKKIEGNPTQAQIDKLAIKLARKILNES